MESNHSREPWNKGKLVGQKPPLKPKDIWAIRIQLQNAHQVRDLAMFNLAIDSKLRGCDLVNLHVRDITHGNQVMSRAIVVQRKTQRPVRADRTDKSRSNCMAREGETEAGAMPVSQPPRDVATCLSTTVRPNRPSLGCRHWPRSDGLWHAYDAANQGNPDLQTHEEPQGGPAVAWP